MKIRDLIKNIDYEYLQGNLDDEVKGLAHDNRLLKPQEGFICIAGTRFDSHDLINDVVAKGASLIVVEKDVELPEGVCAIRVKSSREVSPLLAEAFYDYPARKLKTVAITGSKGKTTSTHMMADIFRAAGYKTGTIGTNGAIMPCLTFPKPRSSMLTCIIRSTVRKQPDIMSMNWPTPLRMPWKCRCIWP